MSINEEIDTETPTPLGYISKKTGRKRQHKKIRNMMRVVLQWEFKPVEEF